MISSQYAWQMHKTQVQNQLNLTNIPLQNWWDHTGAFGTTGIVILYADADLLSLNVNEGGHVI